MNAAQLEGMQARADGRARSGNPYSNVSASSRHWLAGFDLMDSHILHLLGNAQQILKELEQLPPWRESTEQHQTSASPLQRNGASRRRSRGLRRGSSASP